MNIFLNSNFPSLDQADATEENAVKQEVADVEDTDICVEQAAKQEEEPLAVETEVVEAAKLVAEAPTVPAVGSAGYKDEEKARQALEEKRREVCNISK